MLNLHFTYLPTFEMLKERCRWWNYGLEKRVREREWLASERSRDRCYNADCKVPSYVHSVDIQMKPPAITLFEELLAISLIRAIKLRAKVEWRRGEGGRGKKKSVSVRSRVSVFPSMR